MTTTATRQREGFVEPTAPTKPEPAKAVVDISTAAPTEQRETWPIIVKLRHRPIIGNKGEQLGELTFREPTAADINRHGNPVWINAAGEVMFDERKMTAMMAQLSGVLAPLLDSMHPMDWNSCAYRLRRFFLPDWESF